MVVSRTIVLCAALGSACSAFAADPSIRAAPAAAIDQSKVCFESNLSPDIFGFTTGTDVADTGTGGISLQYGGAFAARTGNFAGHGLQAQYAYGAMRCLELGPFVYGSTARNGGFLGAGNGTQWGGGIEIKYKFLGRDTHGVGAMLDIVAQGVAQNGSLFGNAKSSYDGSVSLAFDRVVVPGALYAAINFGYAWNWVDSAPGHYHASSVFRISGALSYQVSDAVFFGAELGHFRRYDSHWLKRDLGHATYLGPTFFWQQPGSNFAVSGAYGYQLGGKARGSANRLDLSNFSQHTAKLKLAYSF